MTRPERARYLATQRDHVGTRRNCDVLFTVEHVSDRRPSLELICRKAPQRLPICRVGDLIRVVAEQARGNHVGDFGRRHRSLGPGGKAARSSGVALAR